jgi:hypothetical protein
MINLTAEQYALTDFLSTLAFPGTGALVSTLVATQFAQQERWSFHYLVSLGIAFSNTIVLIAVFGLKTQDGDNFKVYDLYDAFKC